MYCLGMVPAPPVISRVEDGTGIESVHLGAIGEMGSVLTIPCFYSTEEDRSKRGEGMDRNMDGWK